MTTQDPELSAALGWPGGISDPVLDQMRLLQMVAALRLASKQALEALEDLADCGAEAWSEQRPCVQIGREAITALRAALAQQAEPLNLSDPAVQKRLAAQWGYVPAAAQAEPVQEPVDVGLLEYRGNSVAFIHQKMTAYRTGIDAAWDAFRANGLHPDGKTSLADMIAKHTAPPQRTMVPLTEEEIKTAFHAARNAKLGASQDNSRHRLSVIEIARAVEKASWEKNHG